MRANGLTSWPVYHMWATVNGEEVAIYAMSGWAPRDEDRPLFLQRLNLDIVIHIPGPVRKTTDGKFEYGKAKKATVL
jgi:hypothetical protein